jgi:hypothetical protein
MSLALLSDVMLSAVVPLCPIHGPFEVDIAGAAQDNRFNAQAQTLVLMIPASLMIETDSSAIPKLDRCLHNWQPLAVAQTW